MTAGYPASPMGARIKAQRCQIDARKEPLKLAQWEGLLGSLGWRNHAGEERKVKCALDQVLFKGFGHRLGTVASPQLGKHLP